VRAPLGAILLCDENLSAEEQNLTALLDFFGIPWKANKYGEVTREGLSSDGPRFPNYCILSSASCMAAALEGVIGSVADFPAWLLGANSVYIHDFQETELCRKLLRYLTGTAEADIRRPMAQEAGLTVTNDFPEMCGPLSGLQVSVQPNDSDNCLEVRLPAEEHQNIISTNCGKKFISVTCSGVRFFLNTSSRIIDIRAAATKYFEVKDHFCRAVPIVMYLKWAFASICWRGPAETRGCLIVDDPLLKPRYGFLRFRHALELMDSHNFTTAIAFIPWNWRRTNRETVQQFKSRADRLSLCIHGCDHSAGEFAARSSALLNRRIRTANQRMASLFRRTSLPHDNIMVFPQGMFSPESGRALKLNGMVAAVNTEVAPSGGAGNETKIADLWDVALMKYGSFPIFTRRYLTHGVENLAFDALLGKPCLMVAHHEVFRDRGRELAEFIEKLNSLKWDLRWCSLGEVIRHSFKIRNTSEETCTIQIYGTHVELENTLTVPIETTVMKEEADPRSVEQVKLNRESVEHCYEDGRLKFKVWMRPSEKVEVRLTYFDKLDIDHKRDDVTYRMKMLVRRCLSEFRDNYISQNDWLYATAARVKRLLH
jgi:hypothetical protein